MSEPSRLSRKNNIKKWSARRAERRKKCERGKEGLELFQQLSEIGSRSSNFNLRRKQTACIKKKKITNVYKDRPGIEKLYLDGYLGSLSR